MPGIPRLLELRAGHQVTTFRARASATRHAVEHVRRSDRPASGRPQRSQLREPRAPSGIGGRVVGLPGRRPGWTYFRSISASARPSRARSGGYPWWRQRTASEAVPGPDPCLWLGQDGRALSTASTRSPWLSWPVATAEVRQETFGFRVGRPLLDAETCRVGSLTARPPKVIFRHLHVQLLSRVGSATPVQIHHLLRGNPL